MRPDESIKNPQSLFYRSGGVASTSVIGAKARSLQQMTALGLTVPPGIILPVGFFQPWYDLIGQSSTWAAWCAGKLGIAQSELTGAIRRCFAASLDYRVFAYKAAQGLDLRQPRFALIVQVQIDSDVGGVSFPINPLSNHFDEAAIAANWGLGESVVAGVASPDHFIVNKVDGTVVDRTLGAKQVSVSLALDGGTSVAPHPKRAHYCLNDAQIAALCATISELEASYGHPIDMEWAYAQGTLFVLQVRPITTYVPLPAEMVTAPGSRRTLYMDVAISKGMTSKAPISPIGLDWLAGDIGLMVAYCIGKLALDLKSPHRVAVPGWRQNVHKPVEPPLV